MFWEKASGELRAPRGGGMCSLVPTLRVGTPIHNALRRSSRRMGEKDAERPARVFPSRPLEQEEAPQFIVVSRVTARRTRLISELSEWPNRGRRGLTMIKV